MTQYSASAKRTRKAIVEAYIFLLQSKSFENITVQDILDKAEINRSTFYRYFQDKYDLTRQAVAELIDGHRQIFKKIADNQQKELSSFGDYIETHIESYTALLKVQTSEVNTLEMIAQYLSEMYIEIYGSQTDPILLPLEASLYTSIHLVPFYFHITGKLLHLNNTFDLKQGAYTKQNPFTDAFISVFAKYLRIDENSLKTFLEQNKSSRG